MLLQEEVYYNLCDLIIVSRLLSHDIVSQQMNNSIFLGFQLLLVLMSEDLYFTKK